MFDVTIKIDALNIIIPISSKNECPGRNFYNSPHVIVLLKMSGENQ